MNREIKFRAWDNYDKAQIMYRVVRVNFGIQADYTVEATNDKFKSFLLYDPILMQYTGLKDKNDKEIYEGDIVRVHREGVNGKDESFVKKISFYVGGYESGFNIGKYMSTYTEVIGTVWENPGLLKGVDE